MCLYRLKRLTLWDDTYCPIHMMHQSVCWGDVAAWVTASLFIGLQCVFELIFVPRFWCILCPLCSLLVLRLCPPAVADCIEEAAVAFGTWVTAARLRHTALCKLRALGLHRFECYFRRRGNVLWKNRDCFGLLHINPLSFVLSSPRKQWSLSALVRRSCTLRGFSPADWHIGVGSLQIVVDEESSTGQRQMQHAQAHDNQLHPDCNEPPLLWCHDADR